MAGQVINRGTDLDSGKPRLRGFCCKFSSIPTA